MDTRRFERQVYGELSLDVCWDCHAIWFDQYESAQLSPGAVVALFRLIHEHRSQPMRPLADFMGCPRCKSKLVLTHDLQRTNRLSYYRCTAGHGRLTTFIQFLREKQFVRSLSRPEIEKLKATVKQVRCSSCGGAIDLARDAACPYCRSPISVLDASAVEKTLAGLEEADRRRTSPNAADMAAAFESLLATHRDAPRESPWLRSISPAQSSPVLVDLVLQGIGSLFER
jgi:uncharacterized protein YbaR (Trm112 family)